MPLPTKVDDRVKVLTGIFKDKEGVVTALAPNAPKSIGVHVEGEDAKIATVWFKPEELAKE